MRENRCRPLSIFETRTKRLELVRAVDSLIKSRNWGVFLSTTFRRLTKSITIIEDGQPKEVEVLLNDVASARKEFQYFISHLNYAIDFFDKYVLAFVYFERKYSRAPIHIHALINGILPELCPALQSECVEFFGESDVTPYDPRLPASFYFGWKHVKPDLADFDFLKINSRRRKEDIKWEAIKW